MVGRQGAAAPVPDGTALRDTLDAVLANPAFAGRSLRTALWEWLVVQLMRLVDAVEGARVARPALFWIAAAGAVALVAYAATRGAAGWRARAGGRRADGDGGRGVDDPWRRADEAAAAGHLLDGAHLLYRAVVATLARRGLTRAHPSRTPGDHARALRARGAPAAAPFGDFARRYEAFVYAPGAADPARWRALRAAAEAVAARSGLRGAA